LPEPFNETHLSPALLKEWQDFDYGCQMIVAGFNADRQAYLFLMDGGRSVENLSFPGFAAIGSGSENAMFWLSYRNHHLGKSPKHSAYHAFEAKTMAESSPFVNQNLDLLIANKETHWLLSNLKAAPVPVGSPTTVEELTEMFKEYGPHSTDGLTQRTSDQQAKILEIQKLKRAQ
jgi:hypothetical protein